MVIEVAHTIGDGVRVCVCVFGCGLGTDVAVVVPGTVGYRDRRRSFEFEREVRKLDEVLECYHLSGDYDYLLKVLVEDMQDFREFMVKKLTTINHIGSTHSMFMINEVKHTTAITL